MAVVVGVALVEGVPLDEPSGAVVQRAEEVDRGHVPPLDRQIHPLERGIVSRVEAVVRIAQADDRNPAGLTEAFDDLRQVPEIRLDGAVPVVHQLFVAERESDQHDLWRDRLEIGVHPPENITRAVSWNRDVDQIDSTGLQQPPEPRGVAVLQIVLRLVARHPTGGHGGAEHGDRAFRSGGFILPRKESRACQNSKEGEAPDDAMVHGDSLLFGSTTGSGAMLDEDTTSRFSCRCCMDDSGKLLVWCFIACHSERFVAGILGQLERRVEEKTPTSG